MKPTIYILAFALGLSSCNSRTTEKKADTIQTATTNKKQTNLFVKDVSQYDQSFIDGLSEYNEPIKLIGNFVITGKDTTYFPVDLPINKQTTFKGSKDNKNFALTVTRNNLTNLTYNFLLTDKDNRTVDKKSGKAILGSMFFLASEMDEDTETGDSYGSSEYLDESNNCWFSIRVGNGEDNNGKQRVMLTYGCEDKSKQELNLDECPTLRTE
jgi:hypothetical protein